MSDVNIYYDNFKKDPKHYGPFYIGKLDSCQEEVNRLRDELQNGNPAEVKARKINKKVFFIILAITTVLFFVLSFQSNPKTIKFIVIAIMLLITGLVFIANIVEKWANNIKIIGIAALIIVLYACGTITNSEGKSVLWGFLDAEKPAVNNETTTSPKIDSTSTLKNDTTSTKQKNVK